MNTYIFNRISGFNESKTLTKHISCSSKCKLNGRKCNSYQKWNNDLCWCECKNPIKNRLCKNDYVWNSGTCACEINRYLKVGLMI